MLLLVFGRLKPVWNTLFLVVLTLSRCLTRTDHSQNGFNQKQMHTVEPCACWRYNDWPAVIHTSFTQSSPFVIVFAYNHWILLHTIYCIVEVYIPSWLLVPDCVCVWTWHSMASNPVVIEWACVHIVSLLLWISYLTISNHIMQLDILISSNSMWWSYVYNLGRMLLGSLI